jgi:uracil phosphoribosyltransferase
MIPLKWGAPTIHVVCVIASRPGLKELTELHPHIHVTVGTVDETLTEDGLVLPGLGDAGDRLYKTHLDDDEDLLHPSKRSRSASPSL